MKPTCILTAFVLDSTLRKLHVANMLMMLNVCRTLTFHPDALCLYCGSENQLKVYGWEPAMCFDTLTTGWSRVSDIAVAQKQLVCIYSTCFLKNIHLAMFTVFCGTSACKEAVLFICLCICITLVDCDTLSAGYHSLSHSILGF